MKCLFKAKVLHSKGSATHLVATPHGVVRLPDPARLSVVEMEDGSFFLFREDQNGVSIADTWHESAEEAKEAGESEYVITGWATP